MNRVLEIWRDIGQDSVNLPNFLTLVRILLIPVFIILFVNPTPDQSLAAAIVFTIASVTDMLDGYIARRTGQVTKLGKLLDPIADKLLVLSALILLMNVDRVSALVVLLIIAREVAVTGIRAIAAGEGMIIPAETTGKYKMALQVIAVILLILEGTGLAELGNMHLAGTGTLYLSLVLGYISGGQYVWSFWKQVVAKGCDGRLIIPLQNLNQLCPRLVNRNVIGNLYRLIAGCVVLSFHIATTACSENTTPPQLEAFAYPTTAEQCLAGSRSGAAGATDGRVSAEGIKYMVRTPSNYEATFAHPLLMVYAPAGMSRWASERLTGLTTAATGAGFVVAYADHKQLNIPTVEQLGMIPGLVAKEWCIDEKRVYATGHSDGGTASLALAVLDKTKTIPAAIAPSAAGWRGKDLEGFQCPAPIPVMIMHGKNDTLFPGWGAQTSAWWAKCHGCDVTKTKTVGGGCRTYQGCVSGGATVYCEGSGSHRDWPNLNRVMLEFFAHPEKFL